jgi:hypothetical protein
MANITVNQKVSEAGHRRFWEMRQPIGKNAKGEMQYRECFVDMRSGQDGSEKRIISHPDGWDAKLPDLPSGDPGKQFAYQPPSQRYRDNYDKIRWDI